MEDRVGYFQGLFIGNDALRALLIPIVSLAPLINYPSLQRLSNLDIFQQNKINLEKADELIAEDERLAVSNWNTSARPDIWLHQNSMKKQYNILRPFVKRKIASSLNDKQDTLIVQDENIQQLLRYNSSCNLPSCVVSAGYLLSQKNSETNFLYLFSQFYEDIMHGYYRDVSGACRRNMSDIYNIEQILLRINI